MAVDGKPLPDLSFREAQCSDIPAIMNIRLRVRENVLSDPSSITALMVEDHLRLLGCGWVCEVDGEIIGFSFADNKNASIWALFVLPEYQGRGAGKQLLHLAADWLFSQGHDQIGLATEADTRADLFYAAQGWRRGKMNNAVEVYYSLGDPGGRKIIELRQDN